MKSENIIFRSLGLAAILGAIILTAFILVWNTQRTFGEVAVGDATMATTVPQALAKANLCPQRNFFASSTTGVLDFVDFLSYSTSELLILDATTTNSALRNNTATSSLILVWYPTGTATSTHKYGIKFKNGLLIDYGTGVGTTTIGYRCDG